jgi:c-di-AMP phosphodiesterase-like protein
MAACQLKGVGFEEAAAKLKLAIDAYRKEMSK